MRLWVGWKKREACVCACVRACACMCVHVCVRDRGLSFASRGCSRVRPAGPAGGRVCSVTDGCQRREWRREGASRRLTPNGRACELPSYGLGDRKAVHRGGAGTTRHAAAVASTEHGTRKLYREMHITRIQPAPTRQRQGGGPPARRPGALPLEEQRSRDGARGAEGGGTVSPGKCPRTVRRRRVPQGRASRSLRANSRVLGEERPSVRPSVRFDGCPRRGRSRCRRPRGTRTSSRGHRPPSPRPRAARPEPCRVLGRCPGPQRPKRLSLGFSNPNSRDVG